MKKYLESYIKEIDEKIKSDNIKQEDIDEHLIKIQFFQHERLIHLLVTLTYALLCFISLLFSLSHVVLCFVALILVCFLIPYIRHYFRLENGVQYLYKQYDIMKSKK